MAFGHFSGGGQDFFLKGNGQQAINFVLPLLLEPKRLEAFSAGELAKIIWAFGKMGAAPGLQPATFTAFDDAASPPGIPKGEVDGME
jgi:hypothetical protein